MCDGKDYAVWYNGMIIDYVKAETLREASNQAKRIYGDDASVTPVN